MFVVWHLSIITFNRKLSYLEGTICSGKNHSAKQREGMFWHFLNTSKSYFKTPYSERSIQISLNNTIYNCRTNKQGKFTILINEVCDKSSEITISANNQVLDIIQSYPIFFYASDSKFDVISDIDDTILVSHTLNHFKRISTTLLKQNHKRKTVGFTQDLLEYTKQYAPNYYYVSRSESNLFSLLCDTIAYHNLPKGAFFLTPLLSWYQLLKPNKPEQHKFNVISQLIEQSKDKDYILIGDDTQHDMHVYLDIVKKYRARIKMVFIRQVKPFRTEFQLRNWAALEAEGVAGNYFKPFDKFNPDLLKRVL